MSLRILHVLQDDAGGGAVHAVHLARHAHTLGRQAVVAAPGPELRVRGADAAEFEFRSLPTGRAGRARAILVLARGADIVHAHGSRAATWCLPALRLRPSVVTFHGLHPLRRPAGNAYRSLARLLVRSIAIAADALICVAETEAKDLRHIHPGVSNVHVVRNAVRPQLPISQAEQRAAREALRLPDEALVVLTIGRLHAQKAPLRAVQAANELRDAGIVLLLAGDGELLPSVRAAAGSNVHVLGHRHDVRFLLAACDIVLSTSVWEGLPTGLLEAMWAARPIVCSDAAGNVEAVGGAGIVVRGDDLDGYRAALLQLRDPELRARYGRLGRERVENEFSIHTMLEGVDRVYAGVLDSAK